MKILFVICAALLAAAPAAVRAQNACTLKSKDVPAFEGLRLRMSREAVQNLFKNDRVKDAEWVFKKQFAKDDESPFTKAGVTRLEINFDTPEIVTDFTDSDPVGSFVLYYDDPLPDTSEMEEVPEDVERRFNERPNEIAQRLAVFKLPAVWKETRYNEQDAVKKEMQCADFAVQLMVAPDVYWISFQIK